jgi:hypothetical protein
MNTTSASDLPINERVLQSLMKVIIQGRLSITLLAFSYLILKERQQDFTPS